MEVVIFLVAYFLDLKKIWKQNILSQNSIV
jgi:hypothetical protein